MKRTFTVILAICLLVTATAGLGLYAGAEVEPPPKAQIPDAWWAFETWTGNGTSSVTLGNFINFEELLHSDDWRYGEKVESFNYTVEEVNGNTTITLKEEYLKTMDDEAFLFSAVFETHIVPLILHVTTQKITIDNELFDFGTWTGDGNIEVYLVPTTPNLYAPLFEKLIYNGEEVNSSSYMIHGGMSGMGLASVMLLEEYLKTLPDGEHYFEVYFANVSGSIKLKLEIKTQDTSLIASQKPNDNPETGDSGFVVSAFMLLSVTGCVIITSRKKKITQ